MESHGVMGVSGDQNVIKKSHNQTSSSTSSMKPAKQKKILQPVN